MSTDESKSRNRQARIEAMIEDLRELDGGHPSWEIKPLAEGLIDQGWTRPIGIQWQVVGPALTKSGIVVKVNVKVGDLVRSSWSGSSGAVWEIIELGEATKSPYNGRWMLYAKLKSVSSGRTDLKREISSFDIVTPRA